MVVAVAVVLVVQMPVDEVVDVVAVRDRLVAAVRPVDVVGGVAGGRMARTAGVRVALVDAEDVIVHVVAVRMAQDHYPATLICTGDHDDRVVPAHSLKFGAELQHCQGGPAPVLLRVDTRAGHGMGKPASALAAEYADQLAFAAAHTGLEVTIG